MKDRYRYRTRHPQVSLDNENEGTGESFWERVPAHSPIPSERAQAEERIDAVRRAVAALPEELRTPLILAEYEERSHIEIWKILGCTAKAVETCIYRARRLLRQSLGRLLQKGVEPER